jgi:hypothetical protein
MIIEASFPGLLELLLQLDLQQLLVHDNHLCTPAGSWSFVKWNICSSAPYYLSKNLTSLNNLDLQLENLGFASNWS